MTRPDTPSAVHRWKQELADRLMEAADLISETIEWFEVDALSGRTLLAVGGELAVLSLEIELVPIEEVLDRLELVLPLARCMAQGRTFGRVRRRCVAGDLARLCEELRALMDEGHLHLDALIGSTLGCAA